MYDDDEPCSLCQAEAAYKCRQCMTYLCLNCNVNNPCERRHDKDKDCVWYGLCFKCVPRYMRCCSKCDRLCCPVRACAWDRGQRKIERPQKIPIFVEEDVKCLLLQCEHCDPVYQCSVCEREFCCLHTVDVGNQTVCALCIEKLHYQSQEKVIRAGCINTEKSR